MADKPDPKTLRLAEAYFKLQTDPSDDEVKGEPSTFVHPSESEQGGDTAENLRKLRSGSTHERVNNNHTPDLSPPVLTPSNASSNTNTIRILPTTASVRLFNGSDADYPAREFIRLCEDVMTNS